MITLFEDIDHTALTRNLSFNWKEEYEKLLLQVDEESLWYYYLCKEKGSLVINTVYKRPWGKDAQPSLNLYKKNGRIYWKDMATVNDCGNIIDFIVKLSNCTEEEAFDRIRVDFELTELVDIVLKPLKYVPTKIIKNEYTWIEGTGDLLKFYKKNGITDDTLKKFGVYAVSTMFQNKNWYASSINGFPIFFYKVRGLDNEDYGKFYLPKRKDRFKSNYKSSQVIEGYHQLPETGEILIIDKSLKDVMIDYEMELPAIAFPSENSFKAHVETIKKLKSRFKRIVIMTDNDGPGRRAAEEMKTIFGLDEALFLPETMAKDKFELVEGYGFRTAKEIIYSLLNIENNDQAWI